MSINYITDTYASSDGKSTIFSRVWEPDGDVKAVVQLVHGMAEHSARYTAFAEHLCSLGFAVGAEDHLGHGKTVEKEEDKGYFSGYEGFRYVVEDIHSLTEILQAKYPGKPLIILGHSMGSFLVREYLSTFAEDVNAAVIMGTMGPGRPVGFGVFMAGLVAMIRGEKHKSKLLDKLSSGSNNKRIAKPCSKFAWLTKNEEVVKEYEADPDCGFIFTAYGFRDLFTMIGEINTPEWAKTIPTDLPILLVSGGDDPIGDYGKGIRKVAGLLAVNGAKKLTVKLFPGDRHEILNETDKDEVYAYLDSWIEGVLEGINPEEPAESEENKDNA